MRNFVALAVLTILSRNEYLQNKLSFSHSSKIYDIFLFNVLEIFRNPLDPHWQATEVAGRPRNVVMGRTRTAR